MRSRSRRLRHSRQRRRDSFDQAHHDPSRGRGRRGHAAAQGIRRSRRSAARRGTGHRAAGRCLPGSAWPAPRWRSARRRRPLATPELNEDRHGQSVTMDMVKSLRERTQAGMNDCKGALTEADGDMDKAIDIIQKKGLAKAGVRAERVATEGEVRTWVSPGSSPRRHRRGQLPRPTSSPAATTSRTPGGQDRRGRAEVPARTDLKGAEVPRDRQDDRPRAPGVRREDRGKYGHPSLAARGVEGQRLRPCLRPHGRQARRAHRGGSPDRGDAHEPRADGLHRQRRDADRGDDSARRHEDRAIPRAGRQAEGNLRGAKALKGRGASPRRPGPRSSRASSPSGTPRSRSMGRTTSGTKAKAPSTSSAAISGRSSAVR